MYFNEKFLTANSFFQHKHSIRGQLNLSGQRKSCDKKGGEPLDLMPCSEMLSTVGKISKFIGIKCLGLIII